jgi:hypothetical protein
MFSQNLSGNRMALTMALYFGPVPAWNAPLGEKLAYFVVMLGIIVGFDLIAPTRRRPASFREVAAFVALAVVLWFVTMEFPSWWHTLETLRHR